MKLKFAFGIATAAMLLVGCGDDSVTNINDEAKAKGQMTLKVIDSNTGVAIDSAEVFSLIDGKAFYSDSNGVTSWKKKDIGTYEYTVTKEGYATRTVKVDLMENGEGNIARVEDKMVDVRMYKLGVSVKGVVLVADPHSGDKTAAKNATVVLKYANDFIVPQEVETTTDKNGLYEFEDLAEGLEFTVSVPQFSKDSMTYAYDGSKKTLNPLRSGEQTSLDAVTLTVVGLEPQAVNDNTNALSVEDSVKITFSTELLADSVSTAWKVYKGASISLNKKCVDGTEVLTSASLSKDGKTLQIAPVSKEWTKLATYCLEGVATSTEGVSVPLAFTFVPGNSVEQPANVKDPTAKAFKDDYIKLTWSTKDSTIDGYRVFFKTDKSADYVEYKSWTILDSVATDSTKCRSTSSDLYTNCADEIDENGPGYARVDVNYYWYKGTLERVARTDDYNYTTYFYYWTESETGLEGVVDTCEMTPAQYSAANSKYYYAYEACPQYEKYGSPYYYYYNPLYYVRTVTDTSSCTVKSGSSFKDTPACVDLEEEFGASYEYTDNTYVWNTDWVNVKPGAEDTMAFVKVNNVLTGKATSVKFIILPYVKTEKDIVSAAVEDATTTNEFSVETEEDDK